jgi:caffeoyl-CoA O-methyltransferase
VADRVTIEVGPAADRLHDLQAVDFAYIDADKDGYPGYYKTLIERLEPGGVLVLDNMLRRNSVLDPQDETSRTIAALNERIARDDRADSVLLSLGDGVTIVRRR